MNEKYDVWTANAEVWRIKLEHELETSADNKILIAYEDVAFAFPSSDPNPFSFETPRIDDQKFLEWAKAMGWTAELVLEIKENDVKVPTRVCFKRN